ncbi:MAG: amino acid racemase [Granulosicoccaceae bacterium]
MNQFKRVGILGGMGPQATLLLQQRVLDSVQAEDDVSHLPLLVDMNPQVPSRLDWILHQQGNDPGPVLAQMAKGLETAGAQALAMPCNTAHHFSQSITDAVSIPLLNMLDMASTAVTAKCEPNDNVGMLASPATIGINLFEGLFAPHQLSTVWPDDLGNILATIRRIKATGVSDTEINTMQLAANQCIEKGAKCLVVGCTEFSLLSKQLDSSVPIIDTLDLLVARIHEFAMSCQ